MEFQVRGNGITITDDLREYVTRRGQRLDRLIDRVVDAKLELRALHNHVGPDTVAARSPLAPAVMSCARRRISRTDLAIDEAFEKLEHQVQRVNGKRRNRKAPAANPSASRQEPDHRRDDRR